MYKMKKVSPFIVFVYNIYSILNYWYCYNKYMSVHDINSDFHVTFVKEWNARISRD